MTEPMQIVGLEALTIKLTTITDVVRANLQKAIEANLYRVETRVKEKLSGEVLKNRTGHLRGSIHSQMESDGESIMGVVGAKTDYARRHEYGFTGTEQVKAHYRTIRVAFGKMLETPKQIMVKSFSRKVDYPAHSYLRSTLAEHADQITQDLTQAAQGALA